VTLDGIPENMALSVSLLEMSGGGTLTLLVANFLSNLPESLGGAVGMRQQGRSRRFAIGVWIALLRRGAVLASLADTLMPDAYREGGKWVAFATAAGFLLSFLIAEV
jgi:zinc transporter, ZIP family